MPSDTFVLHAGTNLFLPLISTMHIQQDPVDGSVSWKQRFGIAMPFRMAASRIESSGPADTGRPFMVSVTGFIVSFFSWMLSAMQEH
jgi:hypothetical protein